MSNCYSEAEKRIEAAEELVMLYYSHASSRSLELMRKERLGDVYEDFVKFSECGFDLELYHQKFGKF